jgi:hypothetical protein
MAKGFVTILIIAAISMCLLCIYGCQGEGLSIPGFKRAVHRITIEDYMDKMKAGWIGQMAGVGWGGPTEFHYKGVIMPEDKMPQWKPEKINQFGQDDIYVEMTFLHTLEQY